MINSPPNRLGVCSWSLRPTSPDTLAQSVTRVGVSHLQLALDPILSGEIPEIRTQNTLRSQEITVVSGMIGFTGEDYSTLDTIKATGGVRPDTTWAGNLAHAKLAARLAARFGLPLVTFHAGFIPHEAGAERKKMIDRLRELADVFDASGVRIAFETGQETADTLLDALDELDRPGVGVNFDPANMILYAMGDPVDALAKLAHRVAQIHIKDAIPAKTRGEWGSEVASGTGTVDWKAFFRVMREQRLGADLLIEREAGEQREKDVIAARKLVEKMLKAKDVVPRSSRSARRKTSKR